MEYTYYPLLCPLFRPVWFLVSNLYNALFRDSNAAFLSSWSESKLYIAMVNRYLNWACMEELSTATCSRRNFFFLKALKLVPASLFNICNETLIEFANFSRSEVAINFAGLVSHNLKGHCLFGVIVGNGGLQRTWVVRTTEHVTSDSHLYWSHPRTIYSASRELCEGKRHSCRTRGMRVSQHYRDLCCLQRVGECILKSTVHNQEPISNRT